MNINEVSYLVVIDLLQDYGIELLNILDKYGYDFSKLNKYTELKKK